MEGTLAADRDVADLLHLLDHRAPAPDFAAVQRRAVRADWGHASLDQRDSGSRRSESRATLRFISRAPAEARHLAPARPRPMISVAVRRSAIILALSAAAAAAATAPRSPLRQLLAHLGSAPAVVQQSPAAVVPRPASAAEAAAGASVPAMPRGVAIVPSGRVDVLFQPAPRSGELHIRTGVGSQVAVTASGDGPSYTVGSGTVVIDARETPGLTYDIELPPASQLAEVSVRVDGRTVFARHGAAVVTHGTLQADGSYRVSISH